MSEDRLNLLLRELRAFVALRGWEPFHDPKNLAMAIASEAGELLSELRWVRNEDADAHCQGPAKSKVAEEIGDVLITSLLFCDRVGLDPIEVVRQKMQKNAQKYPIPGKPKEGDG
ncbi:MAG: nucleotide pyrophosphohydrolase [Deltaproteobacteria bacterium]|nr:nucleotide pyrophosphohydrolase [Sandaracinaceae bacterium]MCX7807290.1 nucleotide pyrophosphohydrolase [Deltaproteobacteria bacterium]MDW8247389.1 nucleotide pyrophosphohydrolase [Sandaracinaceae bacterium]